MADKSNPPDDLKMEVKGDGFLFYLRDEARILVKMQSPTVAVVTMWRATEFVAPDAGNIFASSFRKRLVDSAEARFGKDAPHIGEDIERVASALGAPQNSGKTLLEELQESSERSTMERLIMYARSGATFFHNSEKEGFASVVKDSHRENYEISSPRFKLWVRHEFWRREKEKLEAAALEVEGALHEGEVKAEMPAVVRDRDLADAIRQLESIALFEGRQEEVHIRTAGHDGKVYIDMGDDAWRAIEVSPEGWRIVEGEEIPVRFIRPKGLLALPEPAPRGEGCLDELLSLLNLGEGEDGKRNRILILAWLSHAYLPTGPYLPTVPPWLSNVLCDIATGGGFRTRTLYTNRDQEIFQDKRPIILAGIGSVATRSDLLDRAAIVNLPRIDPKARRKEAIISRMLEEAQPQILSAIMDAVAVGLAKKEDVVLEELPRMADFAVWGIATEEALGAAPGEFMAAYTESRQDASDTALEAWALSDTFIEFAHQFAGVENAWEGTATALLGRLNAYVEDEDVKRAKEWPKSASTLGAQINALVPDLLEVGINVSSVRTNKKRMLRIFVTPVQ
jgi:hypothetical protein